jgi:hypothetical protein
LFKIRKIVLVEEAEKHIFSFDKTFVRRTPFCDFSTPSVSGNSLSLPNLLPSLVKLLSALLQ